MPNYCANTLVIEGDKARLNHFQHKARSVERAGKALERRMVKEPLTFGKFLPVPKNVDWFDWCVANWGTKWEPDTYSVYREPNRLVYTFNTAWSPPLEWLMAAAIVRPKLKFILEYDEPGMVYQGRVVYFGGYLAHEEHYSDATYECCRWQDECPHAEELEEERLAEEAGTSLSG
jgi:hypothetical protein